MTDTALLPPDPTKPGRYWLKQHWGDDVVARWNPSGRYWNTGEFSVLTAKDAAVLGCTLASRRPIPGPAALEAVYQVVETLLDVANLAVITPQDEIHVGPVIYAASGAQVKALRDAAAMLRAALSAMEEPTEAMLAAVEFGDAEGT